MEKFENNEPRQIINLLEAPFAAIERDNEKFDLVIGKYRVWNEQFKTVKEAETLLKKKPWELIINSVLAVADMNAKEGVSNYVSIKEEEEKHNGNN